MEVSHIKINVIGIMLYSNDVQTEFFLAMKLENNDEDFIQYQSLIISHRSLG